MQDTIFCAGANAFIESCKMEIIVLKNHVYKVLAGADANSVNTNAVNISSENLSDYRSGQLGDWYYGGRGKQLFSHLRSYKALEAPNQALHQQAASAVTHHQAGDTQEALAIVGKMESSSESTLRCLNELATELSQQPSQ